jgi:hypothetical protein
MCTLMEDDADRMDATGLEHEFVPLIIACMPSLESSSQERDHQIVHLHEERWPAISCTYDKGVHHIRSLSGDELLET